MVLEKYEVVVRTTHNTQWTMFFQADSFAHAEAQANEYLDDKDEIIAINKDYGNYEEAN